jgi:uncharacterized membrane protein YfcA
MGSPSTVPGTMTFLEALLVVTVGFFAGSINTIVGSGSLVTFPTLLAIGYSPVVANVSNTVGLVFGSISGAHGYRRELREQRGRVLVLGTGSFAGGTAGAILLLTLPSSVFDDVVPVLILLACALVVVQPRLSHMVATRRRKAVAHGGFALYVGVLLCGVYGGYFGAAQGVVLLALLGTFLGTGLQEANGVKNVLAGVANVVSAVLFSAVAPVNWAVAGLVAVGSAAGGLAGGRYGRRLPAGSLRVIIVLVALAAGVRVLVGNLS